MKTVLLATKPRSVILWLIPMTVLVLTSVQARPQFETFDNNNRVGGGFRFPGQTKSIQSVQNTYESGSGVGGTGIPCSHPGRFVVAPDGCNRCFCELNSELSPACSRALCASSGFPSSNSNTSPLVSSNG